MLRLRNSADRFIGQEVFSFIIEKNKTDDFLFREIFVYGGGEESGAYQRTFVMCYHDHSQRRRDLINRLCSVLML